ncbi:MAG: alginate export family protein [Cyclobacteriaceae bacterium]
MQQKLNIHKSISILVIWFMAISSSANAQFTIGGQLLSRGEYRNGYGHLIGKGQKPYFGVGQRTRIDFQYDHEKVKFFTSVQDVRTWGSTSQANLTDDFLSVHEAFTEVPLGNLWALKLGRQELNYDNARFLGNLDWALQARSHDFAVVKFEREHMKLHIGAGYNQAKAALAREPYTVNNQYKTAQLLHYENQWGSLESCFLFWNNGLEQDNQGKLKIRYTQTVGFPEVLYKVGDFAFSGFYYRQFGKNITGQKTDAYNASIQASQKINWDEDGGRKLQTTLGYEVLSGTSQQANDNVNRSYNPFYGTNHAYNGYMDFFYAGGRHNNSVGLQDFFLRLRFDPTQKLFLSLNTHHFLAAADVYVSSERLNNTLGTELDFTIGLRANKVISLQGGYSHFFASESFKVISAESNPATLQNWGYVSLLIQPEQEE